jgi:hypothetical protein
MTLVTDIEASSASIRVSSEVSIASWRSSVASRAVRRPSWSSTCIWSRSTEASALCHGAPRRGSSPKTQCSLYRGSFPFRPYLLGRIGPLRPKGPEDNPNDELVDILNHRLHISNVDFVVLIVDRRAKDRACGAGRVGEYGRECSHRLGHFLKDYVRIYLALAEAICASIRASNRAAMANLEHRYNAQDDPTANVAVRLNVAPASSISRTGIGSYQRRRIGRKVVQNGLMNAAVLAAHNGIHVIGSRWKRDLVRRVFSAVPAMLLVTVVPMG